MWRRLRALLAELAGGVQPPTATMAGRRPDDDLPEWAERVGAAGRPATARPEPVSGLMPDDMPAPVSAGAPAPDGALDAGGAIEAAAVSIEEKVIARARKRLRRKANDPEAHFELGRALFAREEGAAALPHLERACRLRPSWLEAHLLCAYELHWQGRWREAEEAYGRVLRIDPLHAPARRGRLAVQLCQPPDALLAAEPPAASGAARCE